MFTFAPLATPPFSAEYAAEVVEDQPLPLFPMLMPEGWAHAPTQLRQALYAKTPVRGIPDIALVYLVPAPANGPPNIAWVRSERADALGATHADFHRVAFANVARRQIGVHVDKLASGLPYALCDGDYLAAERILDPVFLDGVQTMLMCETMMVGVPARGTLVAAPYTGEAEDAVFAQTIAAMFAEATNKPLSPVAFLVERGRITAAC